MDLGARNRKREPGFGLIEVRPDSVDLRRNEYYLTPKGKSLINQLVDILRV
jgi:DNA-binding MarR family transcriptional regulator